MTVCFENIVNIFFIYKFVVTDDVDADAEDVLNELNLISDNEDANLNENRDGSDWSQVGELMNIF